MEDQPVESLLTPAGDPLELESFFFKKEKEYQLALWEVTSDVMIKEQIDLFFSEYHQRIEKEKLDQCQKLFISTDSIDVFVRDFFQQLSFQQLNRIVRSMNQHYGPC